jgi:hypothetical protein
MIATSLLQDGRSPAGTSKGTKVSSVTKNFFESFDFTIYPLNDFIRISTNKFLLGGIGSNLRKDVL